MQADKKSAIDLTELAIGIIVLGIVVSIGAIILTSVGTTQITDAGTYQIANQSFTPTTAGANLASTWVKSVDAVYNTTNNVILNSANYTTSINSDNGVGTISNSTCKVAAGTSCTSWKVTYTVYNISDPRYELPNSAALGLGEFGNWFKILAIVGIAGVILTILFMAFGGKGKEGSAVSY